MSPEPWPASPVSTSPSISEAWESNCRAGFTRRS